MRHNIHNTNIQTILNIIAESVTDYLDEVRYIDTRSYYNSDKRTKKDIMQPWQQEPIKDNDTIRVFHGTDLKNAVQIAMEGVSGQKWTPRKYSYEQGMNPIGLFVSTDFDLVKEFANPFQGGRDKNASVIIEFTAKASDLDTPVWNGQDSYFGQYSNPQPFRDKAERDAQKEKYNIKAQNHEKDYIRNSDNPAMAKNIFDNNEHQALFIGNLNPNMIKRFWVKAYQAQKSIAMEQQYTPMKRSDFLKKYANTEFYNGRDRDGTQKFSQFKSYKLYQPNDDFKGFEDFAKRFVEDEKKSNIKAYNRQASRYGGDEGMIKYYMENAKELFDHEHWEYFDEVMWPKQLRQMLGDEKYQELFDRFGIGIKNENFMTENKKIGLYNFGLNESAQRFLIERVTSKLLREFEEELDPREEYEQDYPNGGFVASEMDNYDLAKWCRNYGDFLYIYDSPFTGIKTSAANTDAIVAEIVTDLYNCQGITPTHEVDYLLNDRKVNFANDYIAVYKLNGVKGENGDYYVVYEQPKD